MSSMRSSEGDEIQAKGATDVLVQVGRYSLLKAEDYGTMHEGCTRPYLHGPSTSARLPAD